MQMGKDEAKELVDLILYIMGQPYLAPEKYTELCEKTEKWMDEWNEHAYWADYSTPRD